MISIDLTGKSALITGGTRGIGRSIARTLAQAGAATASVYHEDTNAAQRSLESLSSLSTAKHRVYQADVGCPSDIDRAAQEVIADFEGRIDILIHNAAAGASGPIAQISLERWQRVFDVNVTAAFLLTKELLPAMPRGSSIVAISSGAGHGPWANNSPYSASKAGLNMFIRTLAQDIGPTGIRANIVSPGSTDTSEEPVIQEIDGNPLHRKGIAQDVANVVLFLCSDLASFVTGQAIMVNGGEA